jgi:hypothetical protein
VDKTTNRRCWKNWLSSGGIGFAARVIVLEIFDDDRPIFALQQPQRGNDYPPLKSGIGRGPNGRPNSNGTHNARGGLVFSACGRIKAMVTVAIPSYSS